MALFLAISRKKDAVVYQHFSWKYVLATFGRWVLPLNKDVTKNPIFVTLAYVFHICLIVVPIWCSGHITLWEESRFEWSWSAIPDGLADWMTIVFLATALFLLLRRIIAADIRFLSTFSDYLLIVVTASPFISELRSSNWTFQVCHRPTSVEDLWFTLMNIMEKEYTLSQA